MAQVRTIQSSFTAGEISPRMLARVDLDSYDNAVKTMLNATPLTHGGVRRRGGTKYIDVIKNSSRTTRLIPFVYSRLDTFALVFNDGVIQFIREGEFVKVGVSSITYEIAHPYTDADLTDLTYAQNGNIMFFASHNHPPMELIRIADDNWTLTPIEFTYNNYADFSFENAYMGFQLITSGDGFTLGDVITITTDGSGGAAMVDISGLDPMSVGTVAVITVNNFLDPPGGQVWTLTCIVDAENREEFTVVGSITGSPIAQWSPGNYPGAVSFYEQRLYFSGALTFPQRIWGSTIGADTILTLGPDDSDAVQFDMSSNRFSQVLHLEAARTLLPLSYNSEFSISGTSNGGITPTGVNVREQSFYGTSIIKPIRIGQEILFVQRDRKKVRAISYDIAIDSNIAPDITIVSEHITGTGITDMTYQQDPDSIAWIIREDGILLSLTHLREQAMTAWARHSTDGKFKALTTIPENETDIVYSLVERVINGNTVHYIEEFVEDAYLDSSIRMQATPTGSPPIQSTQTIFTGFDHLEGKSVSILADGKVHPNIVVSSGSITLLYPAYDIVVGLAYTTTIELLHPDVSLAAGTSQGASTSISTAVVRVQDTVGIEINEKVIPAYSGGGLGDTAPVLFTGDIPVNLLGWRSPFNLKIEQSLPLPATILGVILKLNINEL